MFEGKIKPGERISLVDVANQLEVSVTPVREALTQLTEIQVVSYIQNRGFLAIELNKNEANEIYEVIAALEKAALLSTQFDPGIIKKLEKCQEQFSKAKTALAKVNLDTKFHQLLLENNKNGLIKKIIEDIRLRIFFYELEYMKSNPSEPPSSSSHSTIIKHLKKGDKQKAVEALSKNWLLSINSVLAVID